MKLSTICLTIAVSAAAAATSQAIVVAGYNIPQTGSGFTSINPIAGGAPQVTATPLSATGTLTPNTFGNHFYFTAWSTAVDPAKYYSAILTTDAGSILNLDDLTYSIEDTSGGGSSTFHVRTSLDGFASDIDSFTLNNTQGLVVDRTTDLTGLGPVTGPIEFRFYGTTPNPGVVLGFANHLPGGTGGGLQDVGQNIRFNGTVSSAGVPDGGSTLALLGLVLAGLGGVKRLIRR